MSKNVTVREAGWVIYNKYSEKENHFPLMTKMSMKHFALHTTHVYHYLPNYNSKAHIKCFPLKLIFVSGYVYIF